jgi:hypothetical protein
MGGFTLVPVVQDMDQWTALVNTVMKLRDFINSGKFLEQPISQNSLRKYVWFAKRLLIPSDV